jgi:hypothetical protein
MAELTDTTHRSSPEELTHWVQSADRRLVFSWKDIGALWLRHKPS